MKGFLENNLSWQLAFGALLLVLVYPAGLAQAGFFDQLKDAAKQTTESIIKDQTNKMLNQNAEPEKTVPNQSAYEHNTPPQPDATGNMTLVADIQRELNRLGYSVGTVDGIYGPGTANGIRRYQSDKGLPVDGKPTSLLLTSMQAQKTPATTASGKYSSNYSSNYMPQQQPADSPQQIENFDYLLLLQKLRPDLVTEDVLLNAALMYYEKFGLETSEVYSLKDNEFVRKKKMPLLRSRLADMAASAGTVYSWPTSLVLKDYDFTNHRYPVFKGGTIGRRMDGRLRPYGVIIRLDPLLHLEYLDIPVHLAEQFSKTKFGQSKITKGKIIFQITGINLDGKMLNYEARLQDLTYYMREEYNTASPNGRLLYDKLVSIDIASQMAKQKKKALAKAASKKAKPPNHSFPKGKEVITGADNLIAAVADKTFNGREWAVYFSPDGSLEARNRSKIHTTVFSVKDPLICFESGKEFFEADCVFVGRKKDGTYTFYSRYGSKIGRGALGSVTNFTNGRDSNAFDIGLLPTVAEQDILGITLGMSKKDFQEKVFAYRQDMKQFVSNERETSSPQWNDGLVHVRYESPDGREIIGMNFEPPAEANSGTAVWRSVSYEKAASKPLVKPFAESLFAKFGGSLPEGYVPRELIWADVGQGLIPGQQFQTGCYFQPELRNFPGPYIVGGIQGDPKEDCGETVYVVMEHDGYQLEGFTMMIVNQAHVAHLIKENEKAIKAAVPANVPRL